MPELAEVDYFRRRWAAGAGGRVLRVEVHPGARVFRGCDVALLVERLMGAVMTDSLGHGKQMLFGFSSGGWLGVHLGMTGELRIEGPGWAGARHDHLVLHQAERSLVFADARMFGRLRFDFSAGGEPGWWRDLPPGLLTSGFTADWLAGHLARRARSPLKAVLLDQAVFPGVGNWMADEILWRLGLHPLTPAGELGAGLSSALREQARWLARRALATIGQDWGDPPAGWLYRHRWASGGRCPRPGCATPLVREQAAGRTSCWCPRCQPAVAAFRAGKPVGTGHRREKPLAPRP